jgi:hypothetical protein
MSPQTDTSAGKPYSSPKLKELTPERAKAFLQGQAADGDQGAKDLVALLFAREVSAPTSSE